MSPILGHRTIGAREMERKKIKRLQVSDRRKDGGVSNLQAKRPTFYNQRKDKLKTLGAQGDMDDPADKSRRIERNGPHRKVRKTGGGYQRKGAKGFSV